MFYKSAPNKIRTRFGKVISKMSTSHQTHNGPGHSQRPCDNDVGLASQAGSSTLTASCGATDLPSRGSQYNAKGYSQSQDGAKADPELDQCNKSTEDTETAEPPLVKHQKGEDCIVSVNSTTSISRKLHKQLQNKVRFKTLLSVYFYFTELNHSNTKWLV